MRNIKLFILLFAAAGWSAAGFAQQQALAGENIIELPPQVGCPLAGEYRRVFDRLGAILRMTSFTLLPV